MFTPPHHVIHTSPFSFTIAVAIHKNPADIQRVFATGQRNLVWPAHPCGDVVGRLAAMKRIREELDQPQAGGKQVYTSAATHKRFDEVGRKRARECPHLCGALWEDVSAPELHLVSLTVAADGYDDDLDLLRPAAPTAASASAPTAGAPASAPAAAPTAEQANRRSALMAQASGVLGRHPELLVSSWGGVWGTENLIRVVPVPVPVPCVSI